MRPVAAAALLLFGGASPAWAGAAACGPAVRAEALAPASDPDESVRLACHLRLRRDEAVEKRLVFEGAAASGAGVTCEEGARIGRLDRQPTFPNAAIEIRSLRRPPDPGSGGLARFERPSDVAIRGCLVEGSIRVSGMGLNGQGEDVRLSSRARGHTERAQAAAPTRLSFDRVTLRAGGTIPLYLGPGVTEAALTRARVEGRSSSVAVYLDAESARNTIADTSFAIETGREVIAVDGSARNRITGNSFAITFFGGIYLYRNCGEGGTVRHQTPSDNVVTGNRFRYASPFHLRSVSVGARDGWPQAYCGADDGFPFGSSADNGDGATGNLVDGNVVE